MASTRPPRRNPPPTAEARRLAAENADLQLRLQELEDTLHSIHRGDVDAIIVNDELYTLESAHAASNRIRQDVLSHMEDAVFAFDNDGHVIYLNAAAERRYRVSASDALGRQRAQLYGESPRPDPHRAHGEASDAARPRASVMSVHHLPDGSDIHVESIVSPLRDAGGGVAGTLAVVRDVTPRWRAEARRDVLAGLSDRLRELDDIAAIARESATALGESLRASRAGYGTLDPAGESVELVCEWAAPGRQASTGSVGLADHGATVDHLKRNELVVIPDVRNDPRTAHAAAALEARGARAYVNVPVLERGRLVALLYVTDAHARLWSVEDIAFVRDVAERTRLVIARSRDAVALRESDARLRQSNENLEATVLARTRELVATEEALRQAQKMEAVGQLTGGIAHDFNNLLASISASLQVLQTRFVKDKVEGGERYITMGMDSVRRAAALTQRLLAFARRQTLDPKPTDVNRLVAGMEDLIRRTVGPNVEVEVVGAAGLWTTRIDSSQLESSLLNLCINARDAMLPQGGRLTIETANKWLDDRAAAERQLTPGQYLSLCVTDTGCGMAPDVVKRVFDPFFTTKPLGQGTGLGLSMVYGFVRQSGGQVRIYSELGEGTTMCLYLPRFVGEAAADEHPDIAESPQSGDGETILIVEDEPSIRVLMAEVLEEAGYRTLTAEDGPSGLRLLQSSSRIDFLVTDVGLPGGMNGRQVADAARVVRPTLKVLFITGYAENAAVGNGLLDHGMAVLTKPFEIAALARKVREMTTLRH
jgi:PAS domain S-box-containing protein